MSAPRTLAVLMTLAVAGCSTVPQRPAAVSPALDPASGIEVFVIRRSWHTDIGFHAADLPAQFTSQRARFPRAAYLLFGFGDRHYLLTRGRSLRDLFDAVWPGPGIILTTALVSTPEKAFGVDSVSRLLITGDQAVRLERFVQDSVAVTADGPLGIAPGPYEGSYYYAATHGYSGLHTCNTWTAEALQAAGLPVSSRGVELAAQVWKQVLPLRTQRDGR